MHRGRTALDCHTHDTPPTPDLHLRRPPRRYGLAPSPSPERIYRAPGSEVLPAAGERRRPSTVDEGAAGVPDVKGVLAAHVERAVTARVDSVVVTPNAERVTKALHRARARRRGARRRSAAH